MSAPVAPESPRRERLRRASRLLFLLGLVAVFVGSTVRMDSGPEFPQSDKVQHAAGFFVLAAFAQFGYPAAQTARRLMLALLGYGMLIEVVQALLPWRQFSLLDWAADAAGVALCVLVAARWRAAAVRRVPA